MSETGRRSLYDYRPDLPWLDRLGLSADDLRAIPVREAPDSAGNALGLGYVSPGAPPAEPSRVEPAGTRQLYVWERDTPPDLWRRLRAALRPTGPSGYPKADMFTGVPDVVVSDEGETGSG